LRNEKRKAARFRLHRGGAVGRLIVDPAVGDVPVLVRTTKMNDRVGDLERLGKIVHQPQSEQLAIALHLLEIALGLAKALARTVGERGAIDQTGSRLAERHDPDVVHHVLEQALGQRPFEEIGLQVEHGVVQAHEWLELA
jgi:hypothetical protein